ncbi:MAG: hypothetical protein U5R46_01335 [Gammaproteobacteria bacterium]|nr:hypothetical protein [Gammaproteobacteria bacterium]
MVGTRRKEIDEVAARLARRKRVVVTRSARLGETLYGKLTSPGAFIIAGSAGFLIGEFSRSHAGTDGSPDRSRSRRSPFNDASLWLKTGLALVSWTHAMLDTPAVPRQPGGQDVPDHSPPDV